MTEWKVVPGFSRYEVSTCGKIRRTPDFQFHPKNHPAYTLLTPSPLASQPHYLRVGLLSDDGRFVGAYMHRLVLLTFLGPSPEGCEASHLNSDCQDNRIENLRWESHLENMKRRGEVVSYKGEKNPSAKLDEQTVRKIISLYLAGKSISEISKEFSLISRGAIGFITQRRTWKELELTEEQESALLTKKKSRTRRIICR